MCRIWVAEGKNSNLTSPDLSTRFSSQGPD